MPSRWITNQCHVGCSWSSFGTSADDATVRGHRGYGIGFTDVAAPLGSRRDTRWAGRLRCYSFIDSLTGSPLGAPGQSPRTAQAASPSPTQSPSRAQLVNLPGTHARAAWRNGYRTCYSNCYSTEQHGAGLKRMKNQIPRRISMVMDKKGRSGTAALVFQDRCLKPLGHPSHRSTIRYLLSMRSGTIAELESFCHRRLP